mgnify:CR=1 FL=1
MNRIKFEGVYGGQNYELKFNFENGFWVLNSSSGIGENVIAGFEEVELQGGVTYQLSFVDAVSQDDFQLVRNSLYGVYEGDGLVAVAGSYDDVVKPKFKPVPFVESDDLDWKPHECYSDEDDELGEKVDKLLGCDPDDGWVWDSDYFETERDCKRVRVTVVRHGLENVELLFDGDKDDNFRLVATKGAKMLDGDFFGLSELRYKVGQREGGWEREFFYYEDSEDDDFTYTIDVRVDSEKLDGTYFPDNTVDIFDAEKRAERHSRDYVKIVTEVDNCEGQ